MQRTRARGDKHERCEAATLRDPHRGFEGVVIGEPQQAFYGNQFGLTFPLFEHYDVQLWIPEVGAPWTRAATRTTSSCSLRWHEQG
ncbi:MAG TPA: hypothetical protein VFC19_15590 [Candidatus Limnocylindrales bacterium]|nr:hypothetical protein [Candidatus Limnocylindrales bacterium]